MDQNLECASKKAAESSLAALSAAPVMTPPQNQPAEPISASDAAAALVDAGLAESYDEARADVEAARADVKANAVGDGPMASRV